MSDRASVDSIDALKHFRRALWKFAEAANSALGDAEGEMQKTLTWLETEQPSYWEHQIRKRHEHCEKCKEAVRMKKLYKGPTGQPQNAMEEEKALRIAQRRLEEAHQKLAVTKSYARKLQKELQVYKGSVQRFATSINVDIPMAVAKLDHLVMSLEAYASASAPSVVKSEMAGSSVGGESGGASSMARAADGAPAPTGGAALRLQAPTTEQRNAATPGDLDDSFTLPGFTPEAAAELASLGFPSIPPDPGDRIIIANAAAGQQRLCLQRTEPAAGDTGWYLGPAEAAPPTINPLRAITVARLLALRPDWADLLALPAGVLLVLSPRGIETLLDPADNRLIPPPMVGAAKPVATET